MQLLIATVAPLCGTLYIQEIHDLKGQLADRPQTSSEKKKIFFINDMNI